MRFILYPFIAHDVPHTWALAKLASCMLNHYYFSPHRIYSCSRYGLSCVSHEFISPLSHLSYYCLLCLFKVSQNVFSFFSEQ